jgi:hypothetical protein
MGADLGAGRGILKRNTEVPEGVLLQIGILCAATAMLIKRARRGGK